MSKLTLVVLCVAFLAADFCSAIKITPFTLYDQAQTKLTELQEIVDTAIYTAEAQFTKLKRDFESRASDIALKGNTELQDEAKKIDTNLEVIENLAASSNLDISSCLYGVDDRLLYIYNHQLTKLVTCIDDVGNSVSTQVIQSSRVVESAKDTVYDHRKQLDICGPLGSIICISPVVQQIDLSKIELPEQIEAEERKGTQYIEIISNQVDQCLTQSVDSYITDATLILNNVEVCVNGVLNV